MKPILKIILLVIAGIGVIMLIVVTTFLVFNPLNKNKPDVVETLAAMGTGEESPVPADTNLIFYTWNIGHCGTGKEMGFYSKGGKPVRPEPEQYKTCREGVVYQLTTLDRPDFLFLQDVDSMSARSYRDNQVMRIMASFRTFSASYAPSYSVRYVPLPVFRPPGEVTSGQLTLSRYSPATSERHAYPSSGAWLKKLFMPDLCFLLSRFRVSNGKELVLINLHNIASANASGIKDKERATLRTAMQSEYAKGNYVIAGGDWNQNPLPYDSLQIKKSYPAYHIRPRIPGDFPGKGWQWAYDPFEPSNLDAKTAYQKGHTSVTTVDFFILSPNIELRAVRTTETDFRYSDHQPVGMVIRLR